MVFITIPGCSLTIQWFWSFYKNVCTIQNDSKFIIPTFNKSSGKLSRIAYRGNQATKFFNNLLNNFIEVVKINEDFVGYISKRSASLHSTAPIVIALMLKEIHHGRLMMLAYFSFQFFLKFAWHVLVLSNTRYVLQLYGLNNVKTVLNKAADAIPVQNLTFASV